MRFLFSILCLFCLAACARQAPTCERASASEITFSTASDRVTARSFGPSCGKAVAMIVIRDARDEPLWTWSAPLYPTFGNMFRDDGDGPSPRLVEEFLARWSALKPHTTADAPAWPARAPAPGGAVTTLDRATYEDVRARALPMACYLSRVARETCIFFEPAAAAAAPFIERDAETE